MNYLRIWRKDVKRLTQAEFAGVIGEPRGTYQAYESGRAAIPGDVQEKIRKEGFTEPFPEPDAAATVEDLHALGRDVFQKMEDIQADLTRQNQVLGAALAAILTELQALKSTPRT